MAAIQGLSRIAAADDAAGAPRHPHRLLAHLPAIRTVRDEILGPDRLPASTAVQVVALVRPELLLEVEAFALAE